MGRTYTGQNLALGLNIQATKPLDSREVIDTAADRLLPSTWQDADGNYYTYPGMETRCKDTGQIFVFKGAANDPLAIQFEGNWIESGTSEGVLLTYEEFQSISPKKLQYYYVAKDAEGKRKNKVWRVYLKAKPLFEFDDNGNLSVAFPKVFPTLLA